MLHVKINIFKTCEDWAKGFTSEVRMRGARKNDAMHLREVQVAGFTTVETWHTKEEFTGFLLGWDACMAEVEVLKLFHSLSLTLSGRRLGSIF